MKESGHNRRVLVTGGAGVIGCELLSILLNNNFTVLSVDKNPLPDEKVELLSLNNPNLTHLIKDLSKDSLEQLIDFKPSAIFHLAAVFERSKESPQFWNINWNENTLLSHRVVDIVREIPSLKSFVFASSYLIYSPELYMCEHQQAPVPLNEESHVNPRNITGASKFYTEKELEFLKEYIAPELRIVNARIYRVYGKGSRDIVSRWVRAALRNEEIQVYNRQNRFDFIYARDVALGLYNLYLSEESCGIVNLGCGISTSIGEVITALSSLISVKQSKDMGQVEQYEASTADIIVLRNLTGWEPETSIQEGIRHIIEYERGIL
ncbi:NAD-dependent epimerase/dehydratase family protein [Candidatus Magnetomonas plexicatena]|uniref:NAD-dependent epimerase/dehydratase family protein n=1 Tax=Candidatus Magnetomonas plexicatena TaxID=2552947 RepID=UPI001C787D97|nr:NAD(P)-dependent oxidoreductase [Nitrospirales bacterium LBB_01]